MKGRVVLLELKRLERKDIVTSLGRGGGWKLQTYLNTFFTNW
mgnify:CR=1 FL=1